MEKCWTSILPNKKRDPNTTKIPSKKLEGIFFALKNLPLFIEVTSVINTLEPIEELTSTAAQDKLLVPIL